MLLGMVVCSDAEATFMDGGQLQSTCIQGDADAPVLQIACYSYIFGAIDAFGASMRSSGDCHFMVPPEIPSEQVLAVARRYLKDHPETHHSNASTSIWIALVEAFPCPH